MKVQVLISSFRDSIEKAPGVVATIPRNVDILVVHQHDEVTSYDYDALFQDARVNVIPSASKGLAISRNIAAENATGDLLIPTDDDVRFLPDSFASITKAFTDNPDAQLISFQIVGSNGQSYKPYKSRSFRHSLNSIRRVSSIEIVVRRDAFSEHGLRWDEAFGLNARYPGGLEQAFLKNALDLEIAAFYCPVPIIEHPPDSTGHNHTPASAFFRGAVYAKLFGAYSTVILIAFALKNAWRTGSLRGSYDYVRQLFAGARDYLRANRTSS